LKNSTNLLNDSQSASFSSVNSDYTSTYGTDPYTAAAAAAVAASYHNFNNYANSYANQSSNVNGSAPSYIHSAQTSKVQRHHPYSRSSNSTPSSHTTNNSVNGGLSSHQLASCNADNMTSTAAAILSSLGTANSINNAYPAAAAAALYYHPYYLHHQTDLNSGLSNQK